MVTETSIVDTYHRLISAKTFQIYCRLVSYNILKIYIIYNAYIPLKHINGMRESLYKLLTCYDRHVSISSIRNMSCITRRFRLNNS